jgi:ankyrin repeat protein
MKYHGADLDLIAQLIDKGANVNARNHSGYARILGSAYEPELFDLLVQRGADLFVAQDSGASIWSELKYQPSSVVIIFADKLAELRTPKKTDGKPGSGPLHVFALESRVDLVAYFLKRGVYADERDDSGNTPLHLAKDITIVSLLLNAGADPNARNAVDATPLMKASRYPPTALRLLIAKGADVNAVTKGTGKEKHVLDYFTEANNLEGLQILVHAGADNRVRRSSRVE